MSFDSHGGVRESGDVIFATPRPSFAPTPLDSSAVMTVLLHLMLATAV